MVDIFKGGKLVYKNPDLHAIGKHLDEEVASFYPEYLRVINTQEYKVDLSQRLYDLKHNLLLNRH